MGFSIYTVSKCLFFIPAQKIKQFCGMFRFIFRKLGKQFGKRRAFLLEFMGLGLIVPYKFSRILPGPEHMVPVSNGKTIFGIHRNTS